MATKIPENTAPFQLEELIRVTCGRLVAPKDALTTAGELRGIATDTREDLRGKAFFALRGEHFDGHDYLGHARAAGARVAVVERRARFEPPQGLPLVAVDDTLFALGNLAEHHRRRWEGQLIAVVGSAGKTTTRSVISSLLEERRPGLVHSTAGNLNNRVGVPMVLLGLENCHRFAVVELGTNLPGEIDLLAKMAQPDIAVLTLIDLEHTEGLGDLDGVEREESSVFSHLRPFGVAIGFGDDERIMRALNRSGARVLSYGFAAGRDTRIVERTLAALFASRVTLRRKWGNELEVTSPLMGRSGALAVAGGVTAVEAILGEPLEAEEVVRALGRAGQPGRTQIRLLDGGRIVVDDTYNSNPASVLDSIVTGKELSARTGGRLWLVLGEMLELGALSRAAHEEMGRRAAESGASAVFFVQGDARYSASSAVGALRVEFFDDAGEVASQLAPLLAEQDVVVVKASRGVRAERVVQGLEAFYKPAPAAPSPGNGVRSERAP